MTIVEMNQSCEKIWEQKCCEKKRNWIKVMNQKENELKLKKKGELMKKKEKLQKENVQRWNLS